MTAFVSENEEFEEEGGLYEHYRLTVDPGQSPIRIDKFLSNRIDNASRSRIQAAAEAGNILVNNVAVKSNYKIKPNDEVVIVMDFPRRELKIIPEETSSGIFCVPKYEKSLLNAPFASLADSIT
jgi:23S rRNA pseudouridine1911/1915/1917 synthase